MINLLATSDASQHAIANDSGVEVRTPSPQRDRDFAAMELFLASKHTDESPPDSSLTRGSSVDSIQSSAMAGGDFADILAMVGFDVEGVPG